MAELVILEQPMEAEPPTIVIQATQVTVLALVKLQEGGLEVHLSVIVSYAIKLN